MLRGRSGLVARVGLAICLLTAACSSQEAASSPTSVDPAEAATSGGIVTVRVGAIVNTAAPTADRDERVVRVLEAAATSSLAPIAVEIEVIRIDEIDDAHSAVATLVEGGVTVVMSLCDDATVPAIVDATLAADVLAVTGCVTIPRPQLRVPSPLFIDLAGLNDSSAAIADWASNHSIASVATIASDLIPDVQETCDGIEAAMADREIALEGSATFTGLLDEPAEIVASVASVAGDADAFVVCALAPAAGDIVAALRNAGMEQPIVVPWFADPQQWTDDVNGVIVVAPASRHGDDPVDSVRLLFATVGTDVQAVDVVTADTVAMLAAAAGRSGSVGSSRLASSIRGHETDVLSGVIRVDDDDAGSVSRTYRAISITGGHASYSELITPTRTPQ